MAVLAALLTAACAFGQSAGSWNDLRITPDVFRGNGALKVTLAQHDDLSYTVKDGDTMTLSVAAWVYIDGVGSTLSLQLPDGYIAARTMCGVVMFRQGAEPAIGMVAIATRGDDAVYFHPFTGHIGVPKESVVGGVAAALILGQMTLQVTR